MLAFKASSLHNPKLPAVILIMNSPFLREFMPLSLPLGVLDGPTPGIESIETIRAASTNQAAQGLMQNTSMETSTTSRLRNSIQGPKFGTEIIVFHSRAKKEQKSIHLRARQKTGNL
jgi:hypothetical protein